MAEADETDLVEKEAHDAKQRRIASDWICKEWRSRPHSEQLASAKFIHSNQQAEFGYTLSVGGGDLGGSLLNSLLIVSILLVKQETATSLPWSWRFDERRKGVGSVGE